MIYKGEQTSLDALARRLQSASARYQFQQAKAKERDLDTKEAKDQDIDRLKKELAESRGKQLSDFRQLYSEMVQKDGHTTKGSGQRKQ